jgi:antirestriction protein ArdC
MEESNQQTTVSDVYQIITNRIIEQLEQGTIPWRKTWLDGGMPTNLISGKPYRGINLWLLAMLDYNQNFFLTFNQLREMGGSIKAEEKPNIVIFWKWLEVEDPKTKEVKKRPMLKYYRVYNVWQCEGVEGVNIPKILKPNNPIDEYEFILKSMSNPPVILNRNNQPYYHPEEDYINIPPRDQFKSSEDYYNTLSHELIHASGHKSRLNRSTVMDKNKFGSEKYSIEELIAEFGACYLRSITGLKEQVTENNIAYIQGWIAKLKQNKRMLIYAASQAQKAVDFILNTDEIQMPQKEEA